jgi:glycosyltransferase involved in cell wall biosynthesis
LIVLAREKGLSERVRFHGSVRHDELPELLSRYRATVNLSVTAFDKAAGESMAVGVPVITTNVCTQEMLPNDLRPLFDIADDATGVAGAMQEISSWDEATRERVGHRLREAIVADHSLASFFDKIIQAIEVDSHRLEPERRVVTS